MFLMDPYLQTNASVHFNCWILSIITVISCGCLCSCARRMMCWVFVFMQVWVAVMVPVNTVGWHLLVRQSLTLLNRSALWAFVKSEMGRGLLSVCQSIFLLHCRLCVLVRV